MRFYSPPARKITYIPEELTIKTTITATKTNSHPEMTSSKSFDIMTVSILDNSFQAIECIVALQSEDVSDFISGHAVCYISDTISFKKKDQRLCKCHHI